MFIPPDTAKTEQAWPKQTKSTSFMLIQGVIDSFFVEFDDLMIVILACSIPARIFNLSLKKVL
jgi:hypothetical protein